MCTIGKECKTLRFRSNGCEVPEGSAVCGQQDTLEIAKEFKKAYEEKLSLLQNAAGDDCSQEKIKLQMEWINDLQEQNELLVGAVQELEYEATERVKALEEKLKQSAKCICEVMKKYREHDVTSDLLSEPLQKIFYLENDQKNLLEFVRRVRDNKDWSLSGLKFFTLNAGDLLGNMKHRSKSGENPKVKEESCKNAQMNEALKRDLEEKKTEVENLNKTMMDMRQALTEEVATKHDQVLSLKRDVQHLEERCIQADKQTAFKDDIIKELRKEIKQLKQQGIREMECLCKKLQKEMQTLAENKAQICNECIILQNDKKKLQQLIDEHKSKLGELDTKFKDFVKTKDQLEKKNQTLLAEAANCKQFCCKSDEETKKAIVQITNLKNENTKLHKTVACLQDKLTSLYQHGDSPCMIRIAELESDIQRYEENEMKQKKIQDKYLNRIRELENEICNRQMCYQNEKNLQDDKYLELIARLEIEVENCQRCYHKQLIQQEENYRDAIKSLEYELDNYKCNKHCPNINQDEINILNTTICDIKKNLERAMDVQAQKDEAYQNDIDHLNKIILELKTKICDQKPTSSDVSSKLIQCKQVAFKENPEYFVTCDKIEFNEGQVQSIRNKEEIIKIQNGTANIMKTELQAIKKKETELLAERERHCEEICTLKEKILELETTLNNSQDRAKNLQLAVDLYLNSINVLEASEEKHKLEIEQQKITISNLQDALVASKHELEEIKRKNEESVSVGWASRWFGTGESKPANTSQPVHDI